MKGISRPTLSDLLTSWVLARENANRLGARTLLDFLLDEEGFAIRDIAHVMHVGVHEVRRWRRGAFPSPPPPGAEDRLADFTAMVDVLIEHGSRLARPTGLFAAPILESTVVPDCPLTPMDWYCAGRMDLIFRLLLGEDGGDLMSEFDPEWGTRYATEWEVFKNADGEMAIRPKG